MIHFVPLLALTISCIHREGSSHRSSPSVVPARKLHAELQAACRGGAQDSCVELGWIEEREFPDDYKRVVEWYRTACQHRHQEGCVPCSLGEALGCVALASMCIDGVVRIKEDKIRSDSDRPAAANQAKRAGGQVRPRALDPPQPSVENDQEPLRFQSCSARAGVRTSPVMRMSESSGAGRRRCPSGMPCSAHTGRIETVGK